MRIYILNATLTLTSSIGIASANLVHFCTKSILRLEDIQYNTAVQRCLCTAI